MNRFSIYIIILFFGFFGRLSSNTIWIKDFTNNHESMVKFYNKLLNEFKMTQFKDSIIIIADESKIKYHSGDIMIEFNGKGLSASVGNLTWFYWIGCTMDKNGKWIYSKTGGCMFSDEYIAKNSKDLSKEIINFLKENILLPENSINSNSSTDGL